MRVAAIVSRLCLVLPILLCCGCGLRLVSLDQRGLAPMTPENSPGVAMDSQGHGHAEFRPLFTGHTQTHAYDPTLWRFAKLPCILSAGGDLVLLDTGMNFPAHVTLDVARDRRVPAHLGASFKFAYVDSLSLGEAAARRFPAVVDTDEWALRVLGLTLYRTRGWTLGCPVLDQACYLAFDNRNRRVTVGFERFSPPEDGKWSSYDMYPRGGLPFVRLPVAGQSVELCADTGGGPHLILDRAEWERIAPSVQVVRHSESEYPTWGGMQGVDVYIVRELTLGSISLKSEPVWVRKGPAREVPALVGLGPFADEVVVWDFLCSKFWIGR